MLSKDTKYEVIRAFNSTLQYLHDLIFDKKFYGCMVNQVYPSKLEFIKASVSDTKVSFLDSHYIGCYRKNYKKTRKNDFDIVTFPF